MAVTVRGTGWGGSPSNTSDLLVNYITGIVRALEPQLQFARLGIRQDIPKGFDRLAFPQPYQIGVQVGSIQGQQTGSVFGPGTSVFGSTLSAGSVGIAAITEGTNPTAISWGATAYTASPYQYGVLVQVSDLLVHGSAIEVVDNASIEVQNAMARMVDDSIQAVVNAGTNGVVYAGGKATRASLGAGDYITPTEISRAYKYLAAVNGSGLKPFEGRYYAAVIHPLPETDLFSNTSSGGFQDTGRYASVDDLKAGAMGDYRGIRFMRSAYVNYFNSTTNVFPTTVVGANSFGWGYLQQPTPELVTTPDSYNPLNLYTSIAGKVSLAVTRFEDQTGVFRIVRIETAASN